MNELFQLARDALVLKDDAFTRLRDSGDAFARGITLLVVIALIVGLVTAAAGFIQQVTAGTPEQQVERARQQFLQGIQTARAFSGGSGSEQFWQIFDENVNAGFQMGANIARIAQQTTPLPAPVGDLFKAVGNFLSYPWGRIGGWMFYSILVLIIAKLMGGAATVQEMLGVSALYSIPHLLDALGFIPCAGFLLGVVAFFWGLVIYVKATAVANRFTTGKAVVAVVLPSAVLFLISLILLIAGIGLLAGLFGSAGR
jgi:hypothetical protein